MQEYKPNSHRAREEARIEAATGGTTEKKVQKVVSGATTRKNTGRKLTDIFISEDASNVTSYIFMDILVPTIKNAISNIVTDGVDMLLFGNTRGRRDSGTRRSSEYVSYRSYSDRDNRRSSDNYPSSSRFDYDDICFRTRGDAEHVREQMLDLIDRYGVVTVSDMYDLAGQTAPYTGNRYGWTSLRTAEACRVRDGYILKLPKAMPID